MAGGWLYFDESHGIDPIGFDRDIVFRQLSDGAWAIKSKNDASELGVIAGLNFVYVADDRKGEDGTSS